MSEGVRLLKQTAYRNYLIIRILFFYSKKWCKISQEVIEHHLIHIIFSYALHIECWLFKMQKAYEHVVLDCESRLVEYFYNAVAVLNGEKMVMKKPKKRIDLF